MSYKKDNINIKIENNNNSNNIKSIKHSNKNITITTPSGKHETWPDWLVKELEEHLSIFYIYLLIRNSTKFRIY